MSDLGGISEVALPGTLDLRASTGVQASPFIAGQLGGEFQQALAQGANPPGADLSREAKAAREFETMVISSFLSDAFQSANSTAFGEGFQGEFYSQIFTRAVAEGIVENGGFGIAEMIEKR